MLIALETPAPFAAAGALHLVLSQARQQQLAALGSALTPTTYRQLDLPVVIGQLSAEAQGRFAPDASLGYFVTRGRSLIVDHTGYQANSNADSLLREQLVGPGSSPISFKDAIGRELVHFRPSTHFVARLNMKLLTQKPVVASILRFDAETFGASHANLMLDFHQDKPGPYHVLSAGWHRDSAISARNARIPMRVYLVRSAAPTEYLRDRLVLRDDGRTAPSLGNLARLAEAAPATQVAWLAQVKAAGILFQPQSYDVTLMTADHTWHRSHRPEKVVNATFMRIAIQPQI